MVSALAQAGAEPRAVTHPDGNIVGGLPAETIRLDLEDQEAVMSAVSDIDLVVHLAARAGGIQFQEEGVAGVFDSNRRITDNVLQACRAQSTKRVFLASSLVTYRPASEMLREIHPQLQLADGPSPYAWSKITDEVVASWQEDLGNSR